MKHSYEHLESLVENQSSLIFDTQCENSQLREKILQLESQIELLKGIKPELPPFPSNGSFNLTRFGIRWNGDSNSISTPMDDGYWTPYHAAENALLIARNALENIVEYWNKDRNDEAMHDACWHNVNTAADALERLND